MHALYEIFLQNNKNWTNCSLVKNFERTRTTGYCKTTACVFKQVSAYVDIGVSCMFYVCFMHVAKLVCFMCVSCMCVSCMLSNLFNMFAHATVCHMALLLSLLMLHLLDKDPTNCLLCCRCCCCCCFLLMLHLLDKDPAEIRQIHLAIQTTLDGEVWSR
jgi:hypothetical protein